MEEEDYLEELKDKDLDQLNDDEDGESGNSLDSSKVPDNKEHHMVSSGRYSSKFPDNKSTTWTARVGTAASS